MDLFTRCPHCDTVFRVTTRHLQASGGQVRCGRCHTVFDAFASLTAKPPGENRDASAQQEVRSASPPEATEAAQSVKPSSLAEVERTKVEPAEAEPAEAGIAEAGIAEAGIAETEDDVPELEAAPLVETEGRKAGDSATNLYEWEFKPAPKLRRTGLWLSLSLLLLISGLIQAGTIFRTELMVQFPQIRPLYQLACQRLSCEIGLPRLADQLNIVASDLQFVDAQRPNLVKLTALVRNRARVPVEYPALELTLTNAQQQVVARRVFLPADYLQDAAQTEAGLAGRRELGVSLFLDTGPLRAVGYRIYLFYPSRT